MVDKQQIMFDKIIVIGLTMHFVNRLKSKQTDNRNLFGNFSAIGCFNSPTTRMLMRLICNLQKPNNAAMNEFEQSFTNTSQEHQLSHTNLFLNLIWIMLTVYTVGSRH